VAGGFYGTIQARIHHDDFGRLATWAAADVVALLGAARIGRGTVVDLGCGSGILARDLGAAGFDVLGVDISPAMVELARANAPDATIRCESLWSVDLPSCVAVTAIGEALNYGTDAAAGDVALRDLVDRVARALVPGGVFVFDVATPGRTGAAGLAQQFHDRPDWTLYMRAEEHEGRLDRRITIFERRSDGTYRRVDEHHVLHLYDPAVVETLLGDAGFEVDPRTDYMAAPSGGGLAGWRVFVATRRSA
jgi:SAM-dependent methyltransferase